MSADYNTPTPAPAEAGPITLPLSALLESLLFVADGPVPVAQFAAALHATPRAIETALDELDSLYRQRGLRIQRDKSGIQLTTAPQAAEAVERFLGLESLQRFSRPAVETLAIIAYQQPITRPRIEALRGVNADGVIKSLLTKGLIEEVGRTEGPGRPVLYGTTPAFLQHFGLSALTDLPPLDIDSLLAAAQVGEPEGDSEAAAAPEPAAEPPAHSPAPPADPVAGPEPAPRPESPSEAAAEPEVGPPPAPEAAESPQPESDDDDDDEDDDDEDWGDDDEDDDDDED